MFESGERTDYECGNPRQLIIEAKKASIPFKFPPRGAKASARVNLRSLSSFDNTLKLAIEQAQTYCQSRGVQYAAISNGPQLVIFLATRLDGKSPLDGDSLVFTSYEDLVKGFRIIFETLTPDGIKEKRLTDILGASEIEALPPKLSVNCLDYFQYKYASEFQENLKNAASLVVEDLGRSDALEDDFPRECYCESGPLSQFAMIGKNVLAARYSALFSSSATGSRVEEVNPKKTGATNSFSQQALAEALAKRPIVLIGDVGVGKSSFIKNLLRVRAKDEFKASISIYFDLGSRGNLTKSTKDALLDEIERSLRSDYQLNLQDEALLEAVYRQQLHDFDTGIFAKLRALDNIEFQKKRFNLISELMVKREEHLRLSINHLAVKTRKQIIIVIDNADQRSLAVQQDAFLIAQELSAHWDSIVFLALRPQTFHASKRSGAISAYPPKIFVVPPPKLEDVIEKRLAFALKVAEGRLPVQSVAGLTLHVDSLAILISVLKASLLHNRELLEFVVNVSAGNVRVAIELISRFFGSPNVESEKIVKIVKEGGGYTIPLHEFAKVALLGDYAYFQEEASIASNVFSVAFPDKREHFLSLLILGYVSWEGAPKNGGEGFVDLLTILEELQGCGFKTEQCELHLARLTKNKLLETTERRQLDSSEELKSLGFPECFRVTSLGAYHLKKWASEFSYLEAMTFDTPIFDVDVRKLLAPAVNDSRLSSRYQRADSFASYLDEIWIDIPTRPYFDWADLRSVGKESFSRAHRRLVDIGVHPK